MIRKWYKQKEEKILDFVMYVDINKMWTLCMKLWTLWLYLALAEKCSFFLLISLFLLLFMGPIALFGIIHGSYYIISTSF